MTIYDYVWLVSLCMTMYANTWLCMTMYYNVWIYMTMSDCLRLYMTKYDFGWLPMTMPLYHKHQWTNFLLGSWTCFGQFRMVQNGSKWMKKSSLFSNYV